MNSNEEIDTTTGETDICNETRLGRMTLDRDLRRRIKS